MATNLPTVEELNKLPCEQVCLLMMRCLNTSDFTFMSDLFKVDTRVDLTLVMVDLVKQSRTDLSEVEFQEFCDLAENVVRD